LLVGTGFEIVVAVGALTINPTKMHNVLDLFRQYDLSNDILDEDQRHLQEMHISKYLVVSSGQIL
jgi:hypothetical protein